jgi:hypothetical protein
MTEEQKIVARGPETVVDGHCTECGRDYTYQGEDAIENGRCPSDDCPSHWECVGIKYED